MLNQTTVMALQALQFIMLHEADGPHTPAVIAARLGVSPPYLAKIHTALVKAHILTAHRGARGGAALARPPDQITLLQVVEACEGRILGNYCAPHDDVSQVCGFHAAMHALQHAVTGTLAEWTLADLCKRPEPAPALRGAVNCRMACALRPPAVRANE